jgi:hypothetical protein
MSTYDEQIQAARLRLTDSLQNFACVMGGEQAATGGQADTLNYNGILSNFEASPEFSELEQNPAISSALRVAEVLNQPAYTAEPDVVRQVAVGCWQEEDARINAELYVHQGVLRAAVLEAACIHGVTEDLYQYRDSQGFWFTGTLQEWFLDNGFSESDDYLSAVEDRFGALDQFVAIPNENLQAEDERCAENRDLISPKDGGTWNVGEEISTGLWQAFDVSDCYWARLAENGDIRDNHFGDALRLNVTVQSSDGQFEISGCSFYFANP